MPAQPFEIGIPEATLADLRERLARTRLVPHDEATDWDAGASPAYLRQLVDYWRSEYDWRAQEARINRFAHFRAAVGGTTLHFIHEQGKGPAPVPLLGDGRREHKWIFPAAHNQRFKASQCCRPVRSE